MKVNNLTLLLGLSAAAVATAHSGQAYRSQLSQYYNDEGHHGYGEPGHVVVEEWYSGECPEHCDDFPIHETEHVYGVGAGYEKDYKERDYKGKELKERDCYARDCYERDLKERDFKERDFKERDIKERDYKEKDFEKREYKERDYKEKEFEKKEYERRDFEERDCNEREFKERDFEARDFEERDCEERNFKGGYARDGCRKGRECRDKFPLECDLHEHHEHECREKNPLVFLQDEISAIEEQVLALEVLEAITLSQGEVIEEIAKKTKWLVEYDEHNDQVVSNLIKEAEINAKTAAELFAHQEEEKKWIEILKKENDEAQSLIAALSGQVAVLSKSVEALSHERCGGPLATCGGPKHEEYTKEFFVGETVEFIRQNGLKIGDRWVIREEPTTFGSTLVFRDFQAELDGIDKKYTMGHGFRDL